MTSPVPGQGWYPPLPGPYPAPRPVALAVTPTDYPSFWRTPRWAPWRPIVTLLLAVVGFFVLQVVSAILAVVLDHLTGRVDFQQQAEATAGGSIIATPAIFLINNLGLAALIPLCLMLAWGFTGQSPKWLSSVVGGVRWGWLGRCFLVLTPLWLIYLGFDAVTTDSLSGLAVNPDTPLLIVGIIVTTPLQAAGEEYAFRGLANRAVAGLVPTRARPWGAVLGAVVTSALFMLAHGAGSGWLNLYYFSFGMIACAMTWWTGGLEAAIAMHVVNNLISEATMPFSDISGMFDRGAGAAGPETLIGIVMPMIGAVLIGWHARRAGVVSRTAPGLAQLPVPVLPVAVADPAGWPAPPWPAPTLLPPGHQAGPPHWPAER